MYFALGYFAALLFVYSLISEKVERLSLSGPIVFVAVGVALGPLGLEWFNPSVNFGNGKLLIDLTLALFLFVDAASANLSVLKKKLAYSRQNVAVGFACDHVVGHRAGSDLIPCSFCL